jgi:hypothetical protein
MGHFFSLQAVPGTLPILLLGRTGPFSPAVEVGTSDPREAASANGLAPSRITRIATTSRGTPTVHLHPTDRASSPPAAPKIFEIPRFRTHPCK